MNFKKKTLPLLFSIALLLFFFLFPKPASAFSLGEFIDGVKNVLTAPFQKHELTVDQKIELISGGNENNDNQIDPGDTIKYTFILNNQSDKTYNSLKLKTNISTSEINSIDNIKGTLSIDDSNKTIVIPNIHLTPNQYKEISFEANVNIFKDNDKNLSVEADLLDETNNSVHKAEKKNISVKKLNEEQFNKLLNLNNQ